VIAFFKLSKKSFGFSLSVVVKANGMPASSSLAGFTGAWFQNRISSSDKASAMYGSDTSYALGKLRGLQDTYMLTIPTVSASGLYWPQVGMYNWEDVERFEVKSADGETIGDHLTLPPVKIVNRNLRPEGMSVNVHFGEMGEMVRYQIQKSDGNVLTDASTDPFIVQAGNALTLTTYYRAQQPTSTAQTRFVQMRDATGQIAAQFDSEPQNGQNPTWAWVKDEIVQDAILLPIPAETAPGDYNIYLGFYEPTGNFARLPVTNRQGERLLNDEVPLPRDSTPLVVQVVK
jgi:hypothetical protein